MDSKFVTACPVFRKDITAKKKIVKASMEITAVGCYEAYVNGKRVGDFVFAPGWTSYEKRIQVQKYDVTDLMSEENLLEIYVGEGWYLGRISNNSRHSYKAITPEGFLNLDLMFRPEILDPILKGTKSLRTLLEHYLLHFNINALVQNPAHAIFHDDTGQIFKLLNLINDEMEAKRPGYSELIRCYLIEILLLTVRRLDDASAASSGHDISSFITAYIADNYMEDISLKDLADRMNYSLPYLSKRFKEDTGTTFVKYLQNYRVMQGCRLLTSSRYTFSEITEMVGYKDAKFFSALIKKMTGLSPSDFRRTAGNH
jgi:AraC-like DNA-binding protein